MNKQKSPALADEARNHTYSRKLHNKAIPVKHENGIISASFLGSEVRMVPIEGAEWWVGKDVCQLLEYKDTVNAIKLHCNGVEKHHPIQDRLGRTQEVRIINEPDLFRLITHSRMPEAQRFEAWLFEEVLPQIRRTGAYAPEDDLMDIGAETCESFVADKERHYIACKAVTAFIKLKKSARGFDSDVYERLCKYYRVGLSYKDIATLLKASESTVKRWVDWLIDAGMLEKRPTPAMMRAARTFSGVVIPAWMEGCK